MDYDYLYAKEMDKEDGFSDGYCDAASGKPFKTPTYDNQWYREGYALGYSQCLAEMEEELDE